MAKFVKAPEVGESSIQLMSVVRGGEADAGTTMMLGLVALLIIAAVGFMISGRRIR
ncbi:MAG: hypothetical protein AAGE80_15655 [Pseudomonadota bacterium]